MELSVPKERIVVALGGNALSARATDTFQDQLNRAKRGLQGVADLVANGYNVVVTHGNGPQVGAALLRMELSAKEVAPQPLFICGAQTQGELGYLISSALTTLFQGRELNIPIAGIITRVVVAPDDPDFDNPSKFVGAFYNHNEALKLAKERGWTIKRTQKSNGKYAYRRVVPSPIPLHTVERDAIKALLNSGFLVIAAGGGGIPVVEKKNSYSGIDAVIDKDRASALLAREIDAERLLILTGVEQVALHFGQLDQKNLDILTKEEAQRYLDAGEFPAGSMGPKIEAAIQFLQQGGKEVIITSIDSAIQALEGRTGTRII